MSTLCEKFNKDKKNQVKHRCKKAKNAEWEKKIKEKKKRWSQGEGKYGGQIAQKQRGAKSKSVYVCVCVCKMREK